MNDLVRTLAMTLLLTSFFAVESRSIKRAIHAYMAQALVMVALIACFATRHPGLWVWAATALITKFGLISWMLRRAAAEGDDREVEPWLGTVPSGAFMALLALVSFQVIHFSAAAFMPNALGAVEPYRTNVSVALTLLFVGGYAVLTRRDALKVVIGVCMIENGAHLSLVTLANGMRETVLIGVVTDVVLAVFLLLHLTRGIESHLHTRDTTRLRELRW